MPLNHFNSQLLQELTHGDEEVMGGDSGYASEIFKAHGRHARRPG